jgi:hypothetical protein
VIFPAMSLRFPLNRPDIITVPGIVAQIKARRDPATFGSTHYMPITRSMSAGKRNRHQTDQPCFTGQKSFKKARLVRHPVRLSFSGGGSPGDGGNQGGSGRRGALKKL